MALVVGGYVRVMSGVRHPWTGQTSRVNLGVLTRWVPPELVAAAVAGRARVPDRPSPLTPEFMVYFMIGLALWSQDSYPDVLANLTCSVPELAGASVDKSSLAWARVRLGDAAMGEVFARVAAADAARPVTPGARWAGKLVLAVDGFVVDVAESPVNRAVFGGPLGGTRTTRHTPYPQAKIVTLTECGTHALRAAAIGAYAAPERELAEQLLHGLNQQHMVLFDAGFPSVRLFRLLNATGAAVLMRTDVRVGSNERGLARLPDGTALAVVKMKGRHTSNRPEHQVTLRVIEYRIDNGDTIRLLTNQLDPQQAPAAQLAQLYAQRWQTEQTFREIKTIQQGRDYVLRSRSPVLVRQEIWAHLTLHATLRRLAVDIATDNNTDPDRISFVKVLKHARRTVIAQLLHLAKAITCDLRNWLNPARPPRTSPRTVKRTRNRYKLRPPGSLGQPLTTPAPPRTLTLIPLRT